LDLTPDLQEQVESGKNVYFPDDAHWNAAGHDVAAARLAEFLKRQALQQ
jgi:lysophospholipase L1-like esterase